MVMALIIGVNAMAADSPFSKGSMILGGTVSFASASGDAYENSNGDGPTMFSISPEIGYFVSPGFAVGGMLNVISWSQGDDDASSFGIGPFVGYYFGADKMEIKGAVFPFLKAFFILDSEKENGDKVASITSFGGMAGIDYMLSTAVALQAGVQFSSDSYKPEGSDESVSGTTMTIGAGIEAFVF